MSMLFFQLLLTLLFDKNTDFLEVNASIRKIKGVLVLKVVFSEATYVCVLTYQVASLQYNSNEF